MSVVPFTSANGNCQGKIFTDEKWNITVNGICKVSGASFVKYASSAPPDIRMSYMGSGLPYPNEEVAYEGSVNVGKAPINNGTFTFNLVSPNAYYKENGSKLVAPHVHFTIGSEYFDIPLPMARQFPNRSLTAMVDRRNRSTGR